MELYLLRHPTPYFEESLASYLVRLAKENGYPLSWLLQEFKLSPAKKLKLINCIDDYSILQQISKTVNNRLEVVKNMTVNRSIFNLFDGKTTETVKNNIKPFVEIDRANFCPLCLQEGQYERIYWHFKQIKICLKHKAILVNTCTQCGKAMGTEEVINGTCSCGAILEELIPVFCNHPNIINNQKRLYNAFEIYFDECLVENSEVLGLIKFSYIDFNEYLYSLVERYSNLCTLVELKDDNLFVDNAELKYLFIVEKLYENWPHNFFLILDQINKSIKIDIDLNRYSRDPIYCNPVRFLSNERYSIRCLSVFREAVWKYFLKRYDLQFYLRKLKDHLFEGNFINIKIIERIFGVDYETLSMIYAKSITLDTKYIRLEPIIDFFKLFINENDYVHPRSGYVPLSNFITTFKDLNISLYDMFRIIKDAKIEVKINYFYNGVDMIFVPSKIFKEVLLKLALERVEETNDFHGVY